MCRREACGDVGILPTNGQAFRVPPYRGAEGDDLIIGIDHIAIAADDAEPLRQLFALFGLQKVYQEDLREDRVRSEQFGAGNANVEVLTASDPSAPLGRFLATHGPGLHHVCFRVDNLETTIAQLQHAGLELVNPQPREDLQGRRVFLHPRSGHGVLMGLVERSDKT